MIDKVTTVVERTITVNGKAKTISVIATGSDDRAIELAGRALDIIEADETEGQWREPRSPEFDELKKSE